MSEQVIGALNDALSKRKDPPPMSLLHAVLDVEQRHQYDESREKAIAEAEALIEAWCERQEEEAANANR